MGEGKKPLIFRIRWFRVLLLAAVPLYILGIVMNADRTAEALASVAKGFHEVQASCTEKLDHFDDKVVYLLDCGGVYDRFIEQRDEIVASRGCWNSERWAAFKQGRDLVTVAPINVWCYAPWPF